MKSWQKALGLGASAAVLLAFGGPSRAQSWNYYANNAATSFYVPFVSGSSRPFFSASSYYVDLTLNNGNGATLTRPFTLDTGSIGIVASSWAYTPSSSDMLLTKATMQYSSDGLLYTGTMYLTNVTINGANGQTATAWVPVLSTNSGFIAQLGVGFDRHGPTATTSGVVLPNLNPFLGLTAINGQPVTSMNPGYIISTNDFGGQGPGPGIMLGLTPQNAGGFSSYVQLLPNTTVPSLPPGCTTAGMKCPLSWLAPLAQIQAQGKTFSNIPMLPDTGIGWMILSVPNAGLSTVSAYCGPQMTSVNCLPTNSQVQIYLPGQSQASYTYTAGSPFPGVDVLQGAHATSNVNTGVTFVNNFDYLYDPIGGFVGYRANGLNGSATILPLLALQGTLALQDQFSTGFQTFLMGPTTLQQAGSGTFNGAIFGPGSLTLAGGTVTLAGQNTYTGGTVVNGGTLNVTGSIVGDLAVAPGASFNNSGTVSPDVSWIRNQGTFGNSGTIAGSLANVGTVTNSGTITGAVINGNAGSFTNNGQVDGTFQNAGTLSGSGSVGSLMNGGVVAPGNSIGTLSVSGNFVNAGGVYQAEVNGNGQSDLVNVGGTAALQGGSVYVYAQPGTTYAPVSTYRILNATSGLSGTFASVNELYPFLLSSLSYDANNAYLTLEIGGFAAAAATPTQAAVGAVLDANVSNASGDFAQVLSAMATGVQSDGAAQAALQQLSGNNYAGFSSFMVQGAQLFMNNFAGQTGGGATGGTRVALAEACEVACDATSPALWGAWGGALGGLGTIGASQPTGAVTYNVGGFAAGLDRLMLPGTRVGVTTGYSTGTQWVSGFAGQGRSDTFNVGLYGTYAQGPVYADALAGYAYSWNQMWRPISIPGLQPRTALGQTGASQWYGQLEAGYRFEIGTAANAFVTPFARLQGYTGTQNGFTESGAQSLDLTVAQQTTNSLRSVLGAQLGGSVDLGWRERLALQLRLGWSHEYADVSRPVTATLAGAPAMPFTTYGISPQRDGAIVGFAANTAVAEATNLYLRYEGLVAGQDSAHALTAGVRMTW